MKDYTVELVGEILKARNEISPLYLERTKALESDMSSVKSPTLREAIRDQLYSTYCLIGGMFELQRVVRDIVGQRGKLLKELSDISIKDSAELKSLAAGLSKPPEKKTNADPDVSIGPASAQALADVAAITLSLDKAADLASSVNASHWLVLVLARCYSLKLVFGFDDAALRERIEKLVDIAGGALPGYANLLTVAKSISELLAAGKLRRDAADSFLQNVDAYQMASTLWLSDTCLFLETFESRKLSKAEDAEGALKKWLPKLLQNVQQLGQ